MYDMTRVNAKGYFDSEDSEEARYAKKAAMCAQRLEDLAAANIAGPAAWSILCRDAPYFVKDYHDYYKNATRLPPPFPELQRRLNVIGCESFINHRSSCTAARSALPS
jgi:hypothetical protein